MKTGRHKTKERGVAILFALGILGMMTVLALTFASVSMTNQTIAKNSSDQLSTKALAKSVVERVRVMVTEGFMETPNQLAYFFSRDKNGWETADQIWKLGMSRTSIESALYHFIDGTDYSNYASGYDKKPSWQYVITKDQNNHDKIIGRFAYVALAAYNPAVDLNSLLFNEDGNKRQKSDGTLWESATRLGNALNELDPDVLYKMTRSQLGDTDTSHDTDWKTVVYKLIDLQTDYSGKRRISQYMELDHYARTGDATGVKRVISKAFTPNSVKYPEIFLMETATNVYNAYYRFDLRSITSGSRSKKDILADMLDTEKRNEYTKISDPTNPSKEIPWLSGFNDDNAITEGYKSPNHKAAQIAANMIEFFRAANDEPPVSDSTTWDVSETFSKNNYGNVTNSVPTYIGLQRTPYISGVGLNLNVSVLELPPVQTQVEPTPLYKHTYKVSVEFHPSVELIDLYGDLSGNYNIKMSMSDASFDLKMENPEGSVTPASQTVTVDISQPFSIQQQTFGGKTQSYDFPVTLSEIQNFEEVTNKTGFTARQFKIENIKLNPKNILLQKDSTPNPINIDFASPNKGATQVTSLENGVFSDDINIMIAYRVADPRHNLLPEAWVNSKCAIEGDSDNISPFNFANVASKIIFPPLSGTDTDPEGDCYSSNPADCNAYMPASSYDFTASPVAWEIGAIHRGAPWQTLNLKKYKNGDPTKIGDQTKGGKYDDGDANLLDQVCFTDAQYGKINLNEIWGVNSVVIPALLGKALTGSSTPTATAGTNPEPTSSTENNLFYAEKTKSGTNYFSYRSELAKLFMQSGAYGLVSSSATDPDSKQEEAFAKMVMLFHAEPTFLPRRIYIIGIAQTIQDVGTTSGSGLTMHRDWQGDGSFSSVPIERPIGTGIAVEKKKLALYTAGYYDLASKEFIDVGTGENLSSTITAKQGEYENGADKILAEQKFFAVLEREFTPTPYDYSNPNKKPKWHIVRFEYVE